ncbi:MAG TPA: pyrimidine dimer DNA glycosylase/endonuclease V, partial [Chloroflexota bacterium]|nr:pyrimidine dimer DNA glycosylase/endonuclease V [Chloroflexota bacterium]
MIVRIWNLPVEKLDDQHLLGEHLELHIIWNALTGVRPPGPKGRGWRNHPETRRFEQ